MGVRSEMPRCADCVRGDQSKTGKEDEKRKMRCKEKEVEIFNNPCSEKSSIACFLESRFLSRILHFYFLHVSSGSRSDRVELRESHLTSVNRHSSCFVDTLFFYSCYPFIIIPFIPLHFAPSKSSVHLRKGHNCASCIHFAVRILKPK